MEKELVFVIEPISTEQTGKVINAKGELIDLATFKMPDSQQEYDFIINDLANGREELIELTGKMSMIDYTYYRAFYAVAKSLKLKAKMTVDFYDKDNHHILKTRYDDSVDIHRKYVTHLSNPIKEDLTEYFSRMK